MNFEFEPKKYNENYDGLKNVMNKNNIDSINPITQKTRVILQHFT